MRLGACRPSELALPATPAAAAEDIYVIKSRTANRTCLDNDADTNANARSNLQVYTRRPNNSDQRFCSTGPFRTFRMEACGLAGQGWRKVGAMDSAGNIFWKFYAVETNSLCLDTVATDGASHTGIDLWPCSTAADHIRWYTFVQNGTST